MSISYLGYESKQSSAASDSLSITIPVGCDFIVIGMPGWINNSSYTQSFDNVKIDTNACIRIVSCPLLGGANDSVADVWYYVPSGSGSAILTWDTADAGALSRGGTIFVTYWSGIDTADPVRDSGALQYNGASSTVTSPGVDSSVNDMFVAFGISTSGIAPLNVDLDYDSLTTVVEETTAFNNYKSGFGYRAGVAVSDTQDCHGDYPIILLVSLKATTESSVLIQPSTINIQTTVYAPVVTALKAVTVQPGAVSIENTVYAPTVTALKAVTIQPGVANITLNINTPSVTANKAVSIQPALIGIVLNTYSPAVIVGNQAIVQPGTVQIQTTVYAPVVTALKAVTVQPGPVGIQISVLGVSVIANRVAVVSPAMIGVVISVYAASVIIGITEYSMDYIITSTLKTSIIFNGSLLQEAVFSEELKTGAIFETKLTEN